MAESWCAHRRLHFIGVGGSGMSGLARLAAQRGAICTGSDQHDSDTLASLRGAGVGITLEPAENTLPDPVDTVVISAAIGPTHPELSEARRRGCEVIKYAAMLGRLMATPSTLGVAVAGTHGKSTTTSILCHILIQAQLDPSFIVGAHCAQIGGGSRAGQSPLLIAEACEYDRSFHNLHPTHGIILNVEADHLDLYQSIDEIVESFAQFARLIAPQKPADALGGDPPGGSLLIQHESPHRLRITAGLDCAVETLGFAPQADWRVGVNDGRVLLSRGRQAVATWMSPMPGDHFAYNAAAAAVTAHRLGAPWEIIAAAIASFKGLDRRMQYLGQKRLPDGADAAQPSGGAAPIHVIDDYGHHPTEVETTLRALRQHYQPQRLICVFQPHQHSRTRHLMEQFAVSFGAADIVIVPEIYFVRDSEKERQAVTSGALVERLRKQNVLAMHVHPFEAIVEQLNLMARPGDLVVTMGAGDVWKISRAFLAG